MRKSIRSDHDKS